MTTKNSSFKVRDLRKKDHYMVDDEYLNGYARLCGVYATAVYNSLSRHANFHTQECFPSLDLIAEQHNISKPSVIKAIKSLMEWNIVNVKKEKEAGSNRQMNNVYTLVDKSEWKPKPSRVNQIYSDSRVNVSEEPSKPHDKSRVNDVYCKDTNIKVTNNNVIVASSKTFVFEEELEKLKNSKQRIEKITALYWSKKGFRFTNMPQLVRQLLRDKKAAKGLEGYTGNEIAKTMQHCQDTIQAPYTWTLETVGKKIAEVINKK